MSRVIAGTLFSLLVLSSVAVAQEYPVSSFTFKYGNPRAGLPDLAEVGNLEVELGRREGIWVEPGPDPEPTETVRVGGLPAGAVFDGGGLSAVLGAVVRHYNGQGMLAVYIVPTEGQINPRNGRDLRRDTQDLELTVWVGRVQEARTVARGRRFEKDETINLKQHERIVGNAPLAAGDPAAEEAGVLLKEPINEYLMRLNRHPGRRVDLSISSGDAPGDLVVDLLVNEQKPWFVYAQVSNTGPESTGEIRARTGFIHYQLTNSDDILTTDLISDFKDTMAATFSYSRPFVYPDYWGFRVRGSWIDYTAAELAEGTVDYLGTTYGGGAELVYRPFYWKKMAVEFMAGVNYQNISVTSQTTEEKLIVTEGTGDLIIPFVAATVSRRERTFSYNANLQFEMSVSSVDETNRNQLGRVNVDDDFMILSGGAQGSFYLEPLFNRSSWKKPQSWKDSRLAHEIRAHISGQYAFSNRLFAQTELVLGGMDRVRGYPESTRAGDDGFMVSLEYAYHIPRALKPVTVMQREANESGAGPMKVPEPFLGRYNMRPPDIFALPDWDFLLKAFFDMGATYVTDPDFNESDADLMSAGIGFEIQLSSLAAVRVDWGTVLKAVERGGEVEVDTGDNRLHFRVQVTW